MAAHTPKPTPGEAVPWRGRSVRAPVGFWSLDERNTGTGAVARGLVGGLHGTYVNAPGAVVGPYGDEKQFVRASDQYVDLGNPAKLQITGDLTVAVSYRVGTVAAGSDMILIGKDGNTGGRAYVLTLADYSFNNIGGLTFYFNGGGGGIQAVRDAVSPVAGQDVLALATYTRATDLMALYKDGRHVDARTAGGVGIPTATANVMIGRRAYAGSTEPFTGRIRFAAIWDVPLSWSEVAAFTADPFAEVRPPSDRSHLMASLLSSTFRPRRKAAVLGSGVF